MRMLSRRWWLPGAAVVIAVSVVLGTFAFAASGTGTGRAGSLGETSGILPRDHLTLESAIQVDLSKETVRLPLYRGKANGQTAWFVLLDASDAGLPSVWLQIERHSFLEHDRCVLRCRTKVRSLPGIDA